MTADDSSLYSLRWNDFHANLLSTFKQIIETEDFSDVTIGCEGGKSVKAHKLVLAASSDFFRQVLKENPCSHPIIILKDVNYTELQSIVSFMYHGEVQISQDDLTEFLRTAQSLQIKGLTDVRKGAGGTGTGSATCGATAATSTPTELDLTNKKPQQQQPPPSELLGSDASNDSNNCNNSSGILAKALGGNGRMSEEEEEEEDNMSGEEFDMRYSFQGLQQFPGPSSLTNSSPDGNFAPSLHHRPDPRVRATDPRPCPKCCKIYRSAHTLRTHLEDKHTVCPGYRCVLCGTVAKSRNSLHSHMSRQHRGISTKDLPVVPMPAPFDPKLASKLLSKAGLKFGGGQQAGDGGSGDHPPHHPGGSYQTDTTGSAILDTYLQFIAENSAGLYHGGRSGARDVDASNSKQEMVE